MRAKIWLIPLAFMYRIYVLHLCITFMYRIYTTNVQTFVFTYYVVNRYYSRALLIKQDIVVGSLVPT